MKIDLIVYDQFLNPVKEFEWMRNRMISSGLSDSVFVMGFPVYDNTVKIIPDTLKSKVYDISLSEINFDDIVKNSQNIDDITNHIVISASGQSIPLTAFVEIRTVQEAYKPSVFKPSPETLLHNGEVVVKFEIYFKQKHKKELIKMIHKDILSKNENGYELVLK